ncbi:hypothetical protein [Pseudoduganella sp. UC29_71]|uniref:hypothetical protein n=1 Tax=Pseudoduganella sp. UC29_71 TaxID=3350174 RepID=UPI00366CC5B1
MPSDTINEKRDGIGTRRARRPRHTIAGTSNRARLRLPIVARFLHPKIEKAPENQGLSFSLMPRAAWCSQTGNYSHSIIHDRRKPLIQL